MNVMRAWIVLGLAVGSGSVLPACGGGGAGPYGGDVVALDGGAVQAEVLANAESGEVMVHTWGRDLKTPQPIAAEPVALGSDEHTLLLEPHPQASDPPGLCSRFYGRADWVRGGGVRRGWMRRGAGERAAFDRQGCWQAGRAHGAMWTEMQRGHGPGMGHDGGRGHR